MFCSNCGAALSGGNFCSDCGARIDGSQNAAVQPVPASSAPAQPTLAQSSLPTPEPVTLLTTGRPQPDLGAGYPAPVGATLGASFGFAVGSAFKRYVDFTGRSSRSEFWWWTLFLNLATYGPAILISAIPAPASNEPSPVAFALSLVFLAVLLGLFIPNLAITIRRLHDSNKSGWLLLLSLVPFAGTIIVFVLMLLPSYPDTNRWGACVRAVGRK